MSRDVVTRIIYAIFWVAVIAVLLLSVHLGLNSTFPWYTEKTSFNMYLAMTLVSVVLLCTTLVFTHSLAGLAVETRDRAGGNRRVGLARPWRDSAPLLVMLILFLSSSLFALVSLSDYLAVNYKINTIFVVFTGSLSKIAVGLLALIVYRTGLKPAS